MQTAHRFAALLHIVQIGEHCGVPIAAILDAVFVKEVILQTGK
jgi:hypothetical protein